MIRIHVWICMIVLLVFVLPVVAQQPASTGSANESAASAASDAAVGAAVTGSGTTNFIPLFTNSTTLGDSALFQLATKVGIGNQTPQAKLDVSGSVIFRGVLQLPSIANATATAGTNSQPLDFRSSSFDSLTSAAVSQHFRWQSEPLGNDTASPSGTLNLLFASGTANPAETGLSIATNGALSFAPAQTLPGADVTGDLGDSGQIGNINATGILTAPIAQFSSSLLVPTINAAGNITSQGTITAATANVTGNILAGSIGTGGSGSFGSIVETGDISSYGNISGVEAFFANTGSQTLFLQNFAKPANTVFVETQFNNTGFSTVFTDALGDFTAIGTKSAAVPMQDGTMAKLFAIESPEVWFDDYGTGRLQGGLAEVSIEARFAQTVNLSSYHVFLIPKGDCKGLFVTGETNTGFEVKESGGGRSSVEFDYRIVAHRKGYEKMRLPVAEMPKPSTKAAVPRTK
jgi:hypothetical protein